MSDSLVSIIIPCYKTSRFVSAAIDKFRDRRFGKCVHADGSEKVPDRAPGDVCGAYACPLDGTHYPSKLRLPVRRTQIGDRTYCAGYDGGSGQNRDPSEEVPNCLRIERSYRARSHFDLLSERSAGNVVGIKRQSL